MARYNHRVVERKWREIWNQTPITAKEESVAFTVLVPKEQKELDLENARLLVLADFFAFWFTGKKAKIHGLKAEESWTQIAEELGLWLSPQPPPGIPYDLGVIPRDYEFLSRGWSFGEKLLCGRFLERIAVSELLPDFGGDALRVYFLYQGPPRRDYDFRWASLVSAHRFVQKIWQLGVDCTAILPASQRELERLNMLSCTVRTRVEQKKPHTALAAVMEFLKDKNALSQAEIITLATILRSYTPFLAAELLSLVATL